MSEIVLADLARKLKPYFLTMLSDAGATAGDVAPSPHDLFSVHHTGQLADSQATQFLLKDGSRQLIGNLGVAETITVDGVDISVFKSAYDVHIADPDAHRPWASTASSVQAGVSSSGGSTADVSRGDHVHSAGTGAPTTNVSVTSTNAEGTGTNFSRATHIHAITWSNNPGVASNILGTNGSGELTLSGDFIVDVDTLVIDVSEDSVYISAGTLPSRRGALTVHPANVNQMGFVLEQLSGQVSQLLRIYDYTGNDLLLVTNAGDLESGNPGFVSGLTGWQIAHDGDAEFNNVWVRGSLHASIFVADELHASGGTLAVLTASRIVDDVTLPAAGNTCVLNVEASLETGLNLFPVNSMIRIKAIINLSPGIDIFNLYFTVSSVGSKVGSDPGYYPLTCVLRRPTSGTLGEILPGGTSIVKWGVIGGSAGTYTGGIYLTSDLQYAPYMDIFTVPSDITTWTSEPIVTPRVRVGNLDGVLGLAEQWGIAFGTDLSDTSKPYGIFSDLQASLVGITQTWWDSNQNAVAQVNPNAAGVQSLFWLGPSSSDKKLDYSAQGVLSLRTGVLIGNVVTSQVVLNNGYIWLPFLGPSGAASFAIDLTNAVDFNAPSAYGDSVIASATGKYSRGAVIGSTSTNYIENPVFSVNITDGFGTAAGTGTCSWDNSVNYMFGGSLKIVAGSTTTYLPTDYPGGAGTGIVVANGATIYVQSRVRMSSASGTCGIVIRNITDGNSPTTVNSPAVADTWSLVVASWTNSTGSAKNVQVWLRNATNDSSTIAYFDAVQAEMNQISPFFYGGMSSGYTWSGTVHNSSSVRTNNGYIKYGLSWMTAWTVSCWVYPWQLPSEATDGIRVFEWAYDNNNRIYVWYDDTNNVVRLTWTGNGTQTITTTSSVDLTRDTNTHIAVTYDGTSLKLYIGGTLIDTKTGMTAFAANSNPNYMYVGATNALGNPLNGVVDDFIVVGSALPQETITQLVNAAAATIVVNDTELFMYSSGEGRLRIRSDGLFAQDNYGYNVFGVCTHSEITSLGGFSVTKGDVVLGHNRTDSSAILWDADQGKFGFYGNASSTVQVVIDTDGSLVAGAGAVALDANGIEIGIPTAWTDENNVKWMSGSTVYFSVGGYSSAGQTYGIIEVPSVSSNYQHFLNITCDSPATYESVITLEAQSGSATETQFYVFNDSNASPVGYFLFKGGDVRIEEGLRVGVTDVNPTIGTIFLDGYLSFLAEISDPAAPASNRVKLYIRDNGSGKTQLCARFATGAIQVIATEP